MYKICQQSNKNETCQANLLNHHVPKCKNKRKNRQPIQANQIMLKNSKIKGIEDKEINLN